MCLLLAVWLAILRPKGATATQLDEAAESEMVANCEIVEIEKIVEVVEIVEIVKLVET